MKKRRENTKNFSVEIEKEKFDKLEEKLSEKGITKKEWFNTKVDEEIGNN
nr:MAG TPA: antitoxin [Bacteriophage sp.]DAH31253.1 MAG TPA: antitoxin [Bacteriophage sp.]DAI19380.1 MAG TPA: antitoxin [Caudoviricetes sp.]DAR63441.1 MAG TPA: antitoxin [Caudoviricetes sp.]